MDSSAPVRVGVVDDYDVIVSGVAALLAPHPDLVEVVDCSTEGGPDRQVDVALLDCFALPGQGAELLLAVAEHPHVESVAVYTWAFSDELVDAALGYGASGFLSKGLSGRDLAHALVEVHSGEQVVLAGDRKTTDHARDGRDPVARRWPGQDAGLTERESEVLALITQGRRTADIAAALFLSVNSIKTHTRNVFRKIGVNTRTEAALWGIDHGFRPNRSSRGVWTR